MTVWREPHFQKEFTNPPARAPHDEFIVCIGHTSSVGGQLKNSGTTRDFQGRRQLRRVRPLRRAGRQVLSRTCTKVRLAQMQVCPQLRKALPTTPLAANRTSASSKTMKGALPPSSRLICGAGRHGGFGDYILFPFHVFWFIVIF